MSCVCDRFITLCYLCHYLRRAGHPLPGQYYIKSSMHYTGFNRIPHYFFYFFYLNRSHVNQNHDDDVHILSSDQYTVYAIRSDPNTIISFLGKIVVSGLWIYYILCLTHVRIHNSKDQIKQLLVGDKSIFFSLTCVFSKKKLNT